MRLMGAGLLIAASGLLGMLMAGWYIQRPRQLRDLVTGLHILETEICYAVSDLPTALRRAAAAVGDPVRQLFLGVAQGIEEQPDCPAPIAWAHSLSRMRRGLALKEDEWAALQTVGVRLGASAAPDQARYLRLAQQSLQGYTDRAERERDDGVRLWRYLGIGSGLVLVLLLY